MRHRGIVVLRHRGVAASWRFPTTSQVTLCKPVASDVLRECSGSTNILRIGPNTQPPPRLSGRSCVYLLQLGSKGQGAVDEALYVGESDSIDRRLQQHRRTHGERRLECVLVEVASKSTALEVEALAIRRLKALRVGHVINIVHA